MRNTIIIIGTITGCIFLLALLYAFISPLSTEYAQDVQFRIDRKKAERTRDIAIYYAEADSIRMFSLIQNHERLMKTLQEINYGSKNDSAGYAQSEKVY